MSEETSNQTESKKALSDSKSRLYRLWILGLRLTIGFFILTILWVVVLKWMPIYGTPLMVIRKIEAYRQGKPSSVAYRWVAYNQISDFAKVAVVASEDQRFPQHSGFDWDAIKQAIEDNKHRKVKRGASTISQQVAKNVFLWNGRNYVRKGLEAYFTFLIEHIWGKRRILEVYLNVAEMGDMVFGVEAASQQYFKKSAAQIHATEAATLAAILPSPRRWSVYPPSIVVAQRRNHVLYQMQLLGGIYYLKSL